MPKITYSAFIENISGVMAGSIFKRVISGPIIERTKSPRLPRSQKQQETRGIFSTLAGKWYNVSAINKELWGKFASLQGVHIAGYHAYMRLNVRLLKAGHADLTEISIPPLTPATPEHVMGFAASHAVGQNTITWSTPTGTSVYVQVYFSAEFGFSLLRKEHWGLLQTVRADVGQVIHTHDYPAGTPIAYKARSIDAFGRISPDTTALPPIS
ncbi:MAG: hypothetical protein KAV00_15085 [Phycisphaerae bacterium]|nr:hypothetical protein [Phycisphaerae bacterium]